MRDPFSSGSIIDFHTHVQPDAAGGVAFQQRFGFTDPPRNGSVEELLPIMDAVGVQRVLMVPWIPAQDIFVFSRLQRMIARRAQKHCLGSPP